MDTNNQTANLGYFNAVMPLLSVPENGVIVVAGAWKGDYLQWLGEQFPRRRLYGFEPQRDAYEQTTAKVQASPTEAVAAAAMFNYGLSTATRTVHAGRCGTDGGSVYTTDGKREAWQMRDAVELLHEIAPMIDLLLLNAEGSEWSLIPYLLDEMMHHRIASIALQQHTKYASKERIARVKSYLAEYYDLIYTDGQLDGWEYWRRK